MISAPVDYCLSPQQTLEHRIAAAPPSGFDEFWAGFREALMAQPQRWQGAIDSAANQVVIRSLGAIRIAARVSMPECEVRGVVITSHGYAGVPDNFPEDPEPWTERGLATVRLRVRGYPPSTLDMGDLRGSWILHHLESPPAWIVRGAVADVIQTVRCARSHFGEAMPVTLHGESLGGGLAVIAAAQLTAIGQPPDRLALALPSLGDWSWRLLKYCNGAGAAVNMVVEALRGADRERIAEGLLLYDAALHAPAVRVATLCKLATADDTVPAPSAAAVYNALGSPLRWRFVTRYGHFDGGIADARRHALFERIHPCFADPSNTPEQAMAAHAGALDLPAAGAASPSVPSATALKC